MRAVYENPNMLIEVFDRDSDIITSGGGTKNDMLQVDKEPPKEEKNEVWGGLW